MEEIKVEKTIHEELQEVRYELSVLIQENKIVKTGENKGLGFKYLELVDYLHAVTKLFRDHKLCPIINIVYDPNGIELATLDLYKGAQMIHFQIPTAEVPNMVGIQALGAKDTYLRRYLYNNVLDLAVPDEVDASLDENSKNAKVETRKATEKQVGLIKQVYDAVNIAKILQFYNVETINDLTVQQASAVINNKKKKQGEQ